MVEDRLGEAGWFRPDERLEADAWVGRDVRRPASSTRVAGAPR
ncbi:MAG: hypothetical protein AVDCRST_MAG77-354 [uncultured Chloroflexi bacterium]|uniref:Uncharacterized protein n=1 Tax=uncultured Chloroflexota bacterium TaxID=166587 RepID=A0A6J4H9B8_9CHLR|nr:MAG: hypothetical protein AVDCRST_MAG77-354 [uncultured Chloroflexota bacterium]